MPRRPPRRLPAPGCSRRPATRLERSNSIRRRSKTVHAATQSGTGPAAQALGYTGRGVKVAFIADGLDVNNPDFIRPDGSKVFVDYQDFSGAGTSSVTSGAEAFLDASAVAAQGRKTYDVSGYGYGDGSGKPCNIRVLGVAPGASLVGLNIFGQNGAVYGSVFLEALDYAVNVDHVDVLNESLGQNPFPDTGMLDLVKLTNDAAVAAGTTVIVSSGDNGVGNTEFSPASDPRVITTGASTTYRAYAQTGIDGIAHTGVIGWLDNNISGLSSAGYTQTGRTVDLVAPGDLNWALCTPKPKLYQACTTFSGKPSPVELEGGTSQAAPLTAGAAALVIQAYRQAHHGASPSPAAVKKIIVSTAQDISAPAEQQGAGLLDAYAAVLAAASAPGTTAAGGNGILKSGTQFNVAGATGSVQHLSETLTNVGKTPRTVSLSTRALGTYHSVADATVTLSDKTYNETATTFTVPAGQGRLDGSVAYAGAGDASNYYAEVSFSLISPSGKLAEYSQTQGNGNYADAQVSNPEPGRWTALVFGYPSQYGGTVGNVHFGARTAAWAAFGSLSATSLTLAAGQSRSFTLRVATPAQPGDASGAIVLTQAGSSQAFGAVTTVPVTLRSLAAAPHPTTTFRGVLTGGNGRGTYTGQTAYYQVDLLAGLPAFNASVVTPSAGNTFLAELVDPVTGEAAATSTSSIPNSSGTGSTARKGAQLHVLHPRAGRWTLVVDFYNQVSGVALSQPITVTLDRAPVLARGALPNSPGTVLAAGKPVTIPVTVTNSGPTAEAYFVDGRLDGSSPLRLAPLTTAKTPVPIPSNAIPQYLVPTHTTSITAAASASVPIFFDYFWQFGDPDIVATSAPFSAHPTGTFSSSAVVPGPWAITPFQYGPTGKKPITTVTATTQMTAQSARFDTEVSAPTGDLWLRSLDPTETLRVLTVQPGQSAVIPVTITPSGKPGSVVRGTLYVDDVTSIAGTDTEAGTPGTVEQGNDLAALPYEYRIG